MTIECQIGNGPTDHCGYKCIRFCRKNPDEKLPPYTFKSKPRNSLLEELYEEYPELKPKEDRED